MASFVQAIGVHNKVSDMTSVTHIVAYLRNILCVSLSLSSCAALCTVGGSVRTVASFPVSGNEAIQTGAYAHKLLVQSCSGRPGCGYASRLANRSGT